MEVSYRLINNSFSRIATTVSPILSSFFCDVLIALSICSIPSSSSVTLDSFTAIIAFLNASSIACWQVGQSSCVSKNLNSFLCLIQVFSIFASILCNLLCLFVTFVWSSISVCKLVISRLTCLISS